MTLMQLWTSFVGGLYTMAEHWKLILFITSVATAGATYIAGRITRSFVAKGVFINTVNQWALICGPDGYDFVTVGGNETLETIFPGADYVETRKEIVAECKRERKVGDDGILHLRNAVQHVIMMSGFCRSLSGNNIDAVDAGILGVGHVAEFATVVTFKKTNGDTIIDAFKIDARQLVVLADPEKRAAVGLAHPRHQEVVDLLGVAASKQVCSYSNRDDATRASCPVWKFVDAVSAAVAAKVGRSPHAA